jgi:rSAM/selenodomain-associated transferase 1
MLSARVAAAAFRRFDELLGMQLAHARGNLEELTRFVEQHERWIDWMPPRAGFTAFLRLRCRESTPALIERLRQRDIFLLDGVVFDSPGYVRIGFGRSPAMFRDALDAFGEELRRAAPGGSMGRPDGDVIVFAKAPFPGHAKTRLAAEVGTEQAAALCDAFVHDTLELAAKKARRLYVAVSPPEAMGVFYSRAPHARCFAQHGSDFGTRLLQAFERALADGAQHPVLIGTDSPTLPAHLVSVAQGALMTHDVVLGPAADGGYYLVGMNVAHPGLFKSIDWSTDRVLGQTIARAKAAGLSLFLLPPWYDVDTGRDLKRLESDSLLRTHTRDALKSVREPVVMR